MASGSSTSRRGFVLKAALGLLIVAALGGAVWLSSRGPAATYTTFTVRRGPLDIKVVGGGEIKALESQEIKSQVKGWEGTKILFIVEEGSYVTEEDVRNKKKLVELDSSSLNEKLTTAQISFKGTQASLTEAEKAFDIEVNQAESDIYAAKLEVTFAEMALGKYLGTDVTTVVMSALQTLADEEAAKEAEKTRIAEEARRAREEEAARLAQEAADKAAQEAEAAAQKEATRETAEGGALLAPIIAETVAPPAPQQSAAIQAAEAEAAREITLDDLQIPIPDIDFASFARSEELGNGEASQKLTTLQDALMMARAEQAKATNNYDSQKRLFDRNFITPSELENFKITLDKSVASVTAAETAVQLFIDFEFKKEAQKLMSDYVLAKRKLARTEQQALSKIAQARAKLLSAQGQYKIEAERIRDYEDQIAKCVMVAERAGLVVYGGSGEDRYWNEEPIKEGATVRERQAIITIPDMSKMAVQMNIHESDIKKIKAGQRTRVRVDAFPDRVLEGVVNKVAVLPNAENRWMNPDLKVYETSVQIEGTHEWLKPGMSAEAEVLVAKLDDTMYIPIQSVVPQGGKQVCFVVGPEGPVKREIETGDITVEFITVTKGLEAGEKVLIRPPDGSREEQLKKPGEEDADGETKETPAATTEEPAEKEVAPTPIPQTTAAPAPTEPAA